MPLASVIILYNLEAIFQTALLCINIKYVESEISIFGWHVNHCCPLLYKKMLDDKNNNRNISIGNHTVSSSIWINLHK